MSDYVLFTILSTLSLVLVSQFILIALIAKKLYATPAGENAAEGPLKTNRENATTSHNRFTKGASLMHDDIEVLLEKRRRLHSAEKLEDWGA